MSRKRGEIPDRLAGKQVPDGLPAEGLNEEADAEGELFEDLLQLTRRYQPALGRYAVTGVLFTFLSRYQTEWMQQDGCLPSAEDEDDGEAWKGG